jgi:hypothetical protein
LRRHSILVVVPFLLLEEEPDCCANQGEADDWTYDGAGYPGFRTTSVVVVVVVAGLA